MPSKNRLRSRASRPVLPCVLACALAFACIVRCTVEQPAATAKQPPATTDRASEVVEYWAGNDPEALRPVASAPGGVKLLALEDLPLVLEEPAVVTLGGSTYALEREGLYRLREKGKVVRQTILYRGDAWRLAGHLDRLYVYGARHQLGGIEQITERARTGELVALQCGMVAVFVVTHLSERKIPARVVNCFTADAWHGYDDGHVLVEVLDPAEKRWVLFDATLGARYRKDGRWLDLLDVAQLYRAGGRPDEVEFVNDSSKVDPLTDYGDIYGPFITDEKELAAYVENFKRELNNDAEAIHKWYAHIMQIPLIGNTFVPSSDAEDALLRKVAGFEKLERLTPAQFRERNYPVG